jgi:hypothetical protein
MSGRLLVLVNDADSGELEFVVQRAECGVAGLGDVVLDPECVPTASRSPDSELSELT